MGLWVPYFLPDSLWVSQQNNAIVNFTKNDLQWLNLLSIAQIPINNTFISQQHFLHPKMKRLSNSQPGDLDGMNLETSRKTYVILSFCIFGIYVLLVFALEVCSPYLGLRGTSLGSLRAVLNPRRVSMGTILDHLGATWASLQTNRGYVGPPRATLEFPWAPQGPSWGSLKIQSAHLDLPRTMLMPFRNHL